MVKPHHLVLVFMALWLAACNLPTPQPKTSSLTAVTATAYPGGAVHVSIQYARGKEDKIVIQCTYPDGKGGTTQFTYEDADKENLGSATSFDFQLKKNGTYPVTCRMGQVEKSASFTINEPEIVPPQQPDYKAVSITGTGTWTVNYHNPSGSCTVKAKEIVLQVRDDEIAQLDVYFPTIMNYNPCVTSTSQTSGYRIGFGVANFTDQTVTFTQCGPYVAVGEISYGGGELLGQIICYDNGAGITSSKILNMP